jgi:antitoxin HigA-1
MFPSIFYFRFFILCNCANLQAFYVVGNSAQFWLNLQTQYDLRQAIEENAGIYDRIPKLPQDDVA